MQRPVMGQWCQINAVAVRNDLSDNVTWSSGEIERPLEGMYIGYRSVYDGYKQYETEQESWEHSPVIVGSKYFTPQKTHEVWLFVLSERKNPVYVFPKDVDLTKEI